MAGMDKEIERDKLILGLDVIKKRFPRLMRLLKYILIGTDGEAASCIQLYLMGATYGGEAVSHSGLTTRDRIIHAIKCRSALGKYC